MSTQMNNMLPIPVVSSHGTDNTATVFVEEESYRTCNRTPTVWHGFMFALLLLSTFVILSLQSGNRINGGSSPPPSFTDEKALLPPPPPTTQLSSDLLDLERQLLEYYQSLDVSKAFDLADDDFITKLANRILFKRTTKQPFVVALISDGQLTMKNCVEDLYINVVNTTLFRVFALHDIELEVHQVTLQENSPFNVMHCLETHVGQQVDLLHVSFPRVEFDLSRFAGMLVHFVTPMTEKRKTTKLERFGWLSLESGMQRVFGTPSSSSLEWGAMGDGLHDYTRSGKPGVLWKNWVPGPLGHQFLADATSMLLLHALERQVNASTTTTITSVHSNQEVKSWCYSTHTAPHDETTTGIQVMDFSQWTMATAASTTMEEPTTCEEKKPKQVYYEATSSANGELVFSIAKRPKPTAVHVCCCCSMLCVEEQLKRTVKFAWKHDGGVTPVEPDASTQQRSECLLVAQNLVQANELHISVLASSPVAIPVRIARVIVAY